MSEVKWIKLKVGMFDGESFKKIMRAKIGGESFRDKLTAIWFELMDFAGKCNHGGAFINSREIPYSELEDIAIMIDREVEELNLCMAFFIKEGMIEIIDDVYKLSNWAVYQNEAGLEKIREQKRLAQARWRSKKALHEQSVDAVEVDVDSTVESTDHLPSYSLSLSNSESLSISDIEGKKKIEGVQGEKEKPSSAPYESIKNLYNEICTSFPKCTVMSDARKLAVKDRFSSGYTLEHFKVLFTKAEASSFLKGKNARSWTANFDWMIKDANMAMVLDGNYDDHSRSKPVDHGTGFETSNPFMEMLNERRDRQ